MTIVTNRHELENSDDLALGVMACRIYDCLNSLLQNKPGLVAVDARVGRQPQVPWRACMASCKPTESARRVQELSNGGNHGGKMLKTKLKSLEDGGSETS
jgi:hypothetical protein